MKNVILPIKWISQQKLADDRKISVQRVHNWIRRNKIQSKYDKDLKMTLVNPDTIDVKIELQ